MFKEKTIGSVMKLLRVVTSLMKLAYWILKVIDQATNYMRNVYHDRSLQNAL